MRGIARGLKDFYASHVAQSDQQAVDRAAAALQDAYRHNVFPTMKVTFGAYPHNEMHIDSPGCVRCHDDEHKARMARLSAATASSVTSRKSRSSGLGGSGSGTRGSRQPFRERSQREMDVPNLERGFDPPGVLAGRSHCHPPTRRSPSSRLAMRITPPRSICIHIRPRIVSICWPPVRLRIARS